MCKNSFHYAYGRRFKFIIFFQVGSPCTPEWLSDVNVCPTILNNSLNYKENFNKKMVEHITRDLKYKLQLRDQKTCRKPCLQIKVLTRFISSQDYSVLKHADKKTILVLQLPEDVTAYRRLLTYGWFEFIVDTGSSLGLWLGNYLSQYTHLFRNVTSKKLCK